MKNLSIILLFAMSLNAYAQLPELAQPPKSISQQGWVNGAWKTFGKDSYTIDASSHAVRFLREYTDIDSIIKPSSQWTYTYNTLGLEAQRLYAWWDKYNNIWMPGSVVQNTYNANNKIETTSYYNGLTLINYSYNGGGDLISVETLALQSGTWTLQSKTTYTNNSDGFPIEEFYEDFTLSTPKTRKTYSYYSPGRVSESIEYVLTGIGWLKGIRKFNIYDPAGKLLEEGYYNWPSTTWIKYEKYTYTYLPSGRIDYIMYSEGNSSGAQLSTKYLYEWFASYPTTGISEHDNSDELLMPAIYFDLMGRQVEKQKNVLLIEQSGQKRRKVIIQE